jgi:hypothetical protein
LRRRVSFSLVRGCLSASFSWLAQPFKHTKKVPGKVVQVGPLQVSLEGHGTFSGCLKTVPSQLVQKQGETSQLFPVLMANVKGKSEIKFLKIIVFF